MAGGPITDYKAPQWFRMQPILPLRDFFLLPGYVGHFLRQQ